jgi:hypothetical protein
MIWKHFIVGKNFIRNRDKNLSIKCIKLHSGSLKLFIDERAVVEGFEKNPARGFSLLYTLLRSFSERQCLARLTMHSPIHLRFILITGYQLFIDANVVYEKTLIINSELEMKEKESINLTFDVATLLQQNTKYWNWISVFQMANAFTAPRQSCNQETHSFHRYTREISKRSE